MIRITLPTIWQDFFQLCLTIVNSAWMNLCFWYYYMRGFLVMSLVFFILFEHVKAEEFWNSISFKYRKKQLPEKKTKVCSNSEQLLGYTIFIDWIILLSEEFHQLWGVVQSCNILFVYICQFSCLRNYLRKRSVNWDPINESEPSLWTTSLATSRLGA